MSDRSPAAPHCPTYKDPSARRTNGCWARSTSSTGSRSRRESRTSTSPSRPPRMWRSRRPSSDVRARHQRGLRASQGAIGQGKPGRRRLDDRGAVRPDVPVGDHHPRARVRGAARRAGRSPPRRCPAIVARPQRCPAFANPVLPIDEAVAPLAASLHVPDSHPFGMRSSVPRRSSTGWRWSPAIPRTSSGSRVSAS